MLSLNSVVPKVSHFFFYTTSFGLVGFCLICEKLDCVSVNFVSGAVVPKLRSEHRRCCVRVGVFPFSFFFFSLFFFSLLREGGEFGVEFCTKQKSSKVSLFALVNSILVCQDEN